MGIFNPGAGPDAAGVVQDEPKVEFQAEKNDFLNKLLSNKEKFFRIAGVGAGLCAMLMTGCEKKTPESPEIKIGKAKIALNETDFVTRESGRLYVDDIEHTDYWPTTESGSSPYLEYESPEKFLPADEFAYAVINDYKDILKENKYKIVSEYAGQIADWQFKESDKAAEEYPEIAKEKTIFTSNDDGMTIVYGNEGINIDDDHELSESELKIIAHYLAEILKKESERENPNVKLGEDCVGPHIYHSDDGKWYYSRYDDGNYSYGVWPKLIEKAFFLYMNGQLKVGTRHSHFIFQKVGE